MIDVLIAGGGVAGCAAGIGLARRGFSVAVLDASGKPLRRERGEVIGPSVRPLLGELHVWDRFLAEGHLRCYGMHSAWGQPELYCMDFIFHPHGSGWHIDRARFDEMMTRAARDAGVVVYSSAAPAGIQETDAGWNVAVRGAEGPLELKARFLVDATGRSACVARKMGARRIALDRAVAVTRSYRPRPGYAEPDSFTLVEASRDGWWYSALLPSGLMVALLFTDPEFRHQAALPPHTSARLGGSECVSGPRTYSASSSCLDPIAGGKWLAAGDAASTWDPLSSQGIVKAIRSSLAAAGAIASHFAGDGAAIIRYATQARNSFAEYTRVRQYYYGRERRWPASLFWLRRQASTATTPISFFHTCHPRVDLEDTGSASV